MANHLWTIHFMRISIANLLLFISLYMLFPVVPVEAAVRLGVPVAQTGIMFLALTFGMFIIGPFHAYLVDAYKRKYVCAFSFLVMLAVTAGYGFVTNLAQLLTLAFVQGLGFGMAATAGITLAIDITNSNLRSSGNIAFSWMSRIGMILGIAAGVWVYEQYDFKILLYASIAAGLAGVYFVSRVYVPFRAPIVTKLCSFDRFLLPRGWMPALNLLLIAFLPGILLPMVHPSLDMIRLGTFNLPFFAVVGAGFILSSVITRYFRKMDDPLPMIASGLGVTILSFLLLGQNLVEASGLLLGIGLGLVTSEFLLMFVKLSRHCQRGTGNTTNLLAWESGITLGIATTCYLSGDNSDDIVLNIGYIIAPVALLFFILITYPYFKKKRVR